jgi:TetR/AcrR family transcriptional repressor of nem operon
MKATLEQIVREARELFRERGFAAASMQDLADRVGLKKASLYTRFASKEALVAPVLALTLDESLPATALAGPAWLPAYETVLRGIADALSDRGRCVAMHLAYGIPTDAPEAHAAVRHYFGALRDGLEAILVRRTDAATARMLATDALVRIEGATLWLVTHDDATPMARALAASLDEARRLA